MSDDWKKIKTYEATVKVFVKNNKALFEVLIGGNLLNEWTEQIEKAKENGWIE